MTFQGADTDALRSLADQFTDASGRIEDLLTTLRGLVHSTDWVGPDADDFRSRYDDAHHRGTGTTAQISERGTQLEEEADEQDNVSSDSTSGSPLDMIRRIFGEGQGEGGGESGLPDWLDKSPDIVRFAKERFNDVQKVVDKAQDSGDDAAKKLGDSAESLGKKFLKYAPFIGAVPELKEMFVAMGKGETGLAIGNGFEAMWAVAPNPLIEAGSFINDLSKDVTGSDRSLLEQFGQAQGNSVATRYGESQGLLASDLLGLERGSTGSNVMKSTAGMTSFAIASGNAITAAPNFFSGFWNTANE